MPPTWWESSFLSHQDFLAPLLTVLEEVLVGVVVGVVEEEWDEGEEQGGTCH